MTKRALLFILMAAFSFSLAFAVQKSELKIWNGENKAEVVKNKQDLKNDGVKIQFESLQPGSVYSPVELQIPKTGPIKMQGFSDDQFSVEGMHTTIEDLEYPRDDDFRWSVFETSPYNNYRWGRTRNHPHSPQYAGWCAENGGPPPLHAGVDNYAPDMHTWAIAGPFELMDNLKWVELQFYVDADIEPADYYIYDYFYVGFSVNGSSFCGGYLWGYTGGYINIIMDAETWLNYCGRTLVGASNIWVGFLFHSDFIIQYKGCWLDDIQLKFHFYDATYANFEAMPIAGKAPLEVQFNNMCGGVPTHFIWNFGDGEVLELQEGWPNFTNPIHAYAAGEYDVSLSAWGEGGANMMTIPDLIYADPDYNYLNMELVDGGETYPDAGWDNANDHDIYGNGATVSAMAEDAWAVFNFGNEAMINKIRLLTNTVEENEYTTNSTKDFEIYDSADAQNFNLRFGSRCEEYKGGWNEFDLADPLVTKYIKIVLTSSQGEDAKYRELAEIQFFGSVKQPDIVAYPEELHFSVTTTNTGVTLPQNLSEVEAVDKTAIRFDGIITLPENSTGFMVDQVLDTLANNYEDGDLYGFGEDAQVYYEATKLVPARPCTLKSILAAFWNYDATTRSKDVQFFVWADKSGNPGTKLLALQATVTLDGNVAAWIELDISSYNVVVDGTFWVGHYELTAGAPTSIADDVPTPGANYYSEDSATWTEELYDYLQMAIVEYAEGIPKEDTQYLTVKNQGDGDLVVSDIFADKPWVKTITPDVFLSVPGDSQIVAVTVTSEYLLQGTYYGTLHIISNDPDTPDYSVALVFDVAVSLTGDAQAQAQPSASVTKVLTKYDLSQNYPNPFNPETNIRFELPEEADVILSIYNLQGQLIRTLVSGQLNAGFHNYTWNATNNSGEKVAGGVYVYKLYGSGKSENVTLTSKMILMK